MKQGGLLIAGAAALALAALAATSAERPDVAAQWWAPGDGRTLPASTAYANAYGQLGILNTAGAIDTRGHPFFEPIGANGRACVTCHQPADAMTLSLDSIRARWDESGGDDPLFAALVEEEMERRLGAYDVADEHGDAEKKPDRERRAAHQARLPAGERACEDERHAHRDGRDLLRCLRRFDRALGEEARRHTSPLGRQE